MNEKAFRGVVWKSTGSWYVVKDLLGEAWNCRIKGKFKLQGIRSTNPVAAGDWVWIEPDTSTPEKVGTIVEIVERKNYIVRRSINLSKESHILAANVDLAVMVFTLKMPETTLEFVDRFLASTEAYRIPALIVFNKTDLLNPEEADYVAILRKMYAEVGYDSIETSVTNSVGIEEFKNRLAGKVSVVAGNSGVGKSSLLKSINPQIDVKIGEISDYHLQGKHTTTFAEMHELFENTFLIDTPGIRGFGSVHFEKAELYHFFPEIFKASEACRFYNCSHTHEPGCAVIEAVNKAKIALTRYNSYVNMYEDDGSRYR